MAEERTHAQRWADYFFPGTEVLKNLPGIKDAGAWRREEGLRVALGAINIPEFGFLEAKNLAEELKWIHAALFRECYEWAGQIRTVNMLKSSEEDASRVSSFAPYGEIDEDLDYLGEYVRRFDWDAASFETKRDELAKIHAELNRIHPFREGNGRSTRIFMEHFAARRDVTLSWVGLEKELRRAGSLSLTSLENRIDVRPWAELYRRAASPSQFSDSDQTDLSQLLGIDEDVSRSTFETSLSMHDVHSLEDAGSDDSSQWYVREQEDGEDYSPGE